jgi:uncharacterized protein (DUF362 family)
MKVSLFTSDLNKYYTLAPWNPPFDYPEFPGIATDSKNLVYDGVRKTLHQLGLDSDNYGTVKWNPFKSFIEPGMTVFVKPNTVLHTHFRGKDVHSIITHSSVIRPLIDYIIIALKGSGKIIIGDSHDKYCDFDKVNEVSQLKELVDWYNNTSKIKIEHYDLRLYRCSRTPFYARWVESEVAKNPYGFTPVDIGSISKLEGLNPSKFRVRIPIADYRNMTKNHGIGKHEYLFPQAILESDAVISLSKMKTHRYTGITMALKNFMGIPSWKDVLPHFQIGSVPEGGDEYPSPSNMKKLIGFCYDRMQASKLLPIKIGYAIIEKNLRHISHNLPGYDFMFGGEWYGNDTVWRTLTDLNRIVNYADKAGKMCETQQRKIFYFIDGIIGMDGDGPLEGNPVYSGTFLASENPVAIDTVGATIMGLNYKKIPLVMNSYAKENEKYPLFRGSPDDIEVVTNKGIMNIDEVADNYNYKYEPHLGWKNYLER